MRKLNMPTTSAKTVYSTCIGRVRSNALKSRLEAGESLIDEAEKEFLKKVKKSKLHTIVRETVVNGNISKKELENVYSKRMVPKDSPGRVYYDAIRLSAKLGICPLCSQRVVSTVDHYLPKTEYPRLTVTPCNLIPACSDCNKLKGSSYPATANEAFIHPYFDNIEGDQWLKARIVHTVPIYVEYFVNPPTEWPPLLKERIEFHFRKLELAKLYAVQAAVEISGIRFRLNELLINSGALATQQYLKDAEKSRSHENRNSWQTAFYCAAKNDVTFCNGGFNSGI